MAASIQLILAPNSLQNKVNKAFDVRLQPLNYVNSWLLV